MIDYKNSAFILVRAPSKVISTKKVGSKNEHQKLLQEAIERGLLLYHARTTKRDGKEYAEQPWLLDKTSVPKSGPKVTRQKVEPDELVEQEEPKPCSGLFCPYCEKPMKSTSGRTLHVKAEHPDEYAEYLKNR
jgi:hypothetical protein